MKYKEFAADRQVLLSKKDDHMATIIHLATCEICQKPTPVADSFHCHTGSPLHYTLCLTCAYEYVQHLTPALAINEAQRIIKAHQLLIGGAK